MASYSLLVGHKLLYCSVFTVYVFMSTINDDDDDDHDDDNDDDDDDDDDNKVFCPPPRSPNTNERYLSIPLSLLLLLPASTRLQHKPTSVCWYYTFIGSRTNPLEFDRK